MQFVVHVHAAMPQSLRNGQACRLLQPQQTRLLKALCSPLTCWCSVRNKQSNAIDMSGCGAMQVCGFKFQQGTLVGSRLPAVPSDCHLVPEPYLLQVVKKPRA